MASEQGHTATPWVAREYGSPLGNWFVRGANDEKVTTGPGLNERNAAFIVRAANCHDDLVNAVVDLLAADDALAAFLIGADPQKLGEHEWRRQHGERSERKRSATVAARAALAKAQS